MQTSNFNAMKEPRNAKAYRHFSDQSLLEIYRKTTDRAVIDVLFRRYAHLVMGVCLKYLKDEEAAKDALMTIFEQLMAKIRIFEIQNFNGWIYRLSKNYCLMELRSKQTQKKRHRLWENEQNVAENMGQDLNTWEEEMRFEQKLKRSKAALEKLKPAQKQCIELFYMQERSYKEISKITGFSVKKVKTSLQNGRKNLQKICLLFFVYFNTM